MKVTDLRRKLMAALAAGGLLAPCAVYAADLDTNLVVNSGFENVDFGTTGNYGGPLILNWGPIQGFAYSHDGTGGVPDYAVGGPLAGGGSFYFTSNNGRPVDILNNTQFTQDIDVSTGPAATAIASGQAAFQLSGFFSTFSTQADFGSLRAAFLSAGSASLGAVQIDDNDNGSTATNTWEPLSLGGVVPVGTATVRISLWAGGGNDGYIDNVDFRVTQEVIQPALELTIDRDDGSMTLSNRTGAAEHISGYSITSAFEALVPINWRSIAENYDAGNPGPNQVDAANDWSELTDPATHADLSEADLDSGDGASLAHMRTMNLGTAGTWIQSHREDVRFRYISGGQLVDGIVTFTGNGNEPFGLGDLNVDGDITSADWVILRTNQHTDLSGQSLAEAYRLGDLTGDRQNNHPDFVAFKNAYDAANGAGAFVAMLASIPEPSSSILVLTAGLLAIPRQRRSSHCNPR